MEPSKAVSLISELIHAEVKVIQEVNSQRGLSKKTNARERKAVSELFAALTGFPPSPEQLNEATGV